jgi:hypothetical protein
MTYLSLTQFETRHRTIVDELEREHAKAAGGRVVEVERPRRPRRPRRWLRAVRGASDGRADPRTRVAVT